MAHKDWCGKPCAECAHPCVLDISMSCSPDCPCLDGNGIKNRDECEKCGCVFTEEYDATVRKLEQIGQMKGVDKS